MTEFSDLSTFGSLGRTNATGMQDVHPSDHNAFATAADSLRAAGVTLEGEHDTLAAQVAGSPTLALLDDPLAGIHIPLSPVYQFSASRFPFQHWATIGDSITNGTVESCDWAHGGKGSWPELLGQHYANQCGGLAGPGFRGLWNANGTGGLPTAGSQEWSATGSWSVFPGFSNNIADVTPFAECFTASGVNNVLKWTVPATWGQIAGFALRTVDVPGDGGVLSYRVDGGSWVNLTVPNGGTNAGFYSYQSVTATSTIEFRAANAATQGARFHIQGIDPYFVGPVRLTPSQVLRNTFSLDNMGRDGFALNNLVRPTSTGDPLAFLNNFASLSFSALRTDYDLVLCGFSNDVVLAPDLSLWTSNWSALKARCDATNTALVAWSPFEQGGRDYTLQATFRTALKTWCAANNVPLIDFYERWQKLLGYSSAGGAGYTACNAAGLMGNGNPLTNGDQVHPSQLGNFLMYQAFRLLLTLFG